MLYAQNGTKMVKNAVWLALILWGVTFGIFLFMLAPAGAVVSSCPAS